MSDRMPSASVHRQAAFTLLELLIATSVFAVLGAMAYSGLNTILQHQVRTQDYSDRMNELRMIYGIMQRDFEQFANRGMRDAFGDKKNAFIGSSGVGLTGIEFTRSGYANPAGLPRSELQRVAYFSDEDGLRRRSWRVLDRAQDSIPDEITLIEKLERFSLRFMGDTGQWYNRWPPQQQGTFNNNTDPGFPQAVDVQLELEDIGELRWVFRLPVAFVPTQPAGAGGENAANGETADGAVDDNQPPGAEGAEGEAVEGQEP